MCRGQISQAISHLSTKWIHGLQTGKPKLHARAKTQRLFHKTGWILAPLPSFSIRIVTRLLPRCTRQNTTHMYTPELTDRIVEKNRTCSRAAPADALVTMCVPKSLVRSWDKKRARSFCCSSWAAAIPSRRFLKVGWSGVSGCS